jgi:hypothetical protein
MNSPRRVEDQKYRRRLLTVVWVFSIIIWSAIISIYAGTFWAMHKTQERTACYQAILAAKLPTALHSVEAFQQCPKPGPLESFIRRTVDLLERK